MDTVLSIKIDNQKLLDLKQLSLSLHALTLQYDSFLRKSDIVYTKNERNLQIVNIKQGSLLMDLTVAALPLIQEFNSVVEFYNYLKKSVDYFLGKLKKPPYLYSKQDLCQFHEIVNQTAKDGGSTFILQIKDSSINMNDTVINSIDANAMQNIIKRLIENSEEKQQIFFKELMYWANANFVASGSKTSDKVIIEKIDEAPKSV
jgi:hypothetical protein